MKTVFIFGINGRIGSAICKACQDEGYKVIGADIVELEKFYKNHSKNVFYKICDVSSTENIKSLISYFIKEKIKIDSCVNASYPTTPNWGKKFEKLEMCDLTENFRLQLASTIIISQQFYELFLDQGYGNLIHMSSIQGIAPPKFEHYEGTDMYSPIEYAAIKAGIISITKWLAKFSKKKSIRFNCVSPGGILDKQPKKFLKKYQESCSSKGMLDAKDIVGTVLFLISDKSKYINGQNIVVDDGWSL